MALPRTGGGFSMGSITIGGGASAASVSSINNIGTAAVENALLDTLGSTRGRDSGTSSGDNILDELTAINDVSRATQVVLGTVDTSLSSSVSSISGVLDTVGRVSRWFV